MIITGYYRNGKIEIPEEYQNLKENTRVKIEIPQEPQTLPPLHPELEKLVRSIETQLGTSYSYTPTDKTDREIFAEALEESDKYGR